MESLFSKWKTKIPSYSEVHKELFNSLSSKYGSEGEKKLSLGKHFSTNYELYLYAFYLGLYNDEFVPITKQEKKTNFSYEIMNWGSKSTSLRKDFTTIQEHVFIATFAKCNVDVLELDKGNVKEDDIVRELIYTLESYTNGGLILIREELETNPNYFFQPSSFLQKLLKCKAASSKKSSIGGLTVD
ncbi:MAG: hypothetical protein FJX80_02670 [Bacteroidetes bacterium]|nr:hypothetical protein [Bacteroidota bacterium]